MTVILLLALMTIASATSSTSSPSFSPKPFGISPSLLLRGGADDAVISVSGLSDVNDIILKNPTALIVLDFTATWCGPCKMITPFYHTLSEKYDKVVFLSVDVDEVRTTSAYVTWTYAADALFFALILLNCERVTIIATRRSIFHRVLSNTNPK